jgi:hypothetical protein
MSSSAPQEQHQPREKEEGASEPVAADLNETNPEKDAGSPPEGEVSTPAAPTTTTASTSPAQSSAKPKLNPNAKAFTPSASAKTWTPPSSSSLPDAAAATAVVPAAPPHHMYAQPGYPMGVPPYGMPPHQFVSAAQYYAGVPMQQEYPPQPHRFQPGMPPLPAPPTRHFLPPLPAHHFLPPPPHMAEAESHVVPPNVAVMVVVVDAPCMADVLSGRGPGRAGHANPAFRHFCNAWISDVQQLRGEDAPITDQDQDKMVDDWLQKNPNCRFLKRVWIDAGRDEGKRKAKEFVYDLGREKKKKKKREAGDGQDIDPGGVPPSGASPAADSHPEWQAIHNPRTSPSGELALLAAKADSHPNWQAVHDPRTSPTRGFAYDSKGEKYYYTFDDITRMERARAATISDTDPDCPLEGWDLAEVSVDGICLERVLHLIEQDCKAMTDDANSMPNQLQIECFKARFPPDSAPMSAVRLPRLSVKEPKLPLAEPIVQAQATILTDLAPVSVANVPRLSAKEPKLPLAEPILRARAVFLMMFTRTSRVTFYE